ncbi:MAG: metallophosphoesterase [Clostridiales bacterium]|nr:metallophosphoesterase [Clostridiales bacterium]
MSEKSLRIVKRIAVVLLCLIVAATVIPTSLFASASEPGKLSAGVVSDIHYFSPTVDGNDCQAYRDYCENDMREYYEGEALLDSALYAFEKHAEETGLKYVFVPGDLTANGEYDAHVALAEKFREFEERTGIQVIVTNGNHDINNPNATTFKNGIKEKTDRTTPEQFREIYSDFGWDLACSTYTPKTGKQGMLSYAVRLDGGYRLIVMDSCKYSVDATEGVDRNRTDGALSNDQLEWVAKQAKEAKECGETLIGMCHHSVVAQYALQETIFKAFIMDNWERRADALADMGMKFVFTGHIHQCKTASYVSDNGAKISDIITPSLIGYPNNIREVTFDNTGEVPTASVKTLEVDCEKPITVGDKTYEQPFSQTYSYGKTFGDKGFKDLALRLTSEIVDSFCADVKKDGLVGALKNSYNVDVETLIGGLIGEGISLGALDVFTTKNVMSFINDLAKQVEENYLSDPSIIKDLAGNVVDQLLSIKVSELPCTEFIDTYGFGSESEPGDLEDLAHSALIYIYNSMAPDVDDDAFVNDALDYFKNGDGAKAIFDAIYQYIFKDLIEDNILSTLKLNVGAIFPSGTFGHVTASFLDLVLGTVLKGDKSYKNVVNSFLSLGFLEYKSIDDIADHFIDEYLTKSQLESIGYTVWWMVDDLIHDYEGTPNSDTVLYATENNPVEATRENYRLPSMVTQTIGEDASTSVNINWYTKYSIYKTDIEIIPYSDDPQFTGTPTKRSGIKASNEWTVRKYPAVDFGIFGFMTCAKELIRHTVTLTDLEPGKKYSYRVGDSEHNWWSEPGVIKTADRSDDVTFIHVTDEQSQNALQYETFHNVISAAYELYPDADFTVSSGDQVDSGTNLKQWKWLLDGSSDVLMKTPFMPAAGNHESSGNALGADFVLPNVPEQDASNGVYYSYDYNNVHFMVLNTNALSDKKGLSDEQISWLKNSANNSGADWKIVVIHKAVYSNGSHYADDDVSALRAQFKRLMPELGIDVVLQGHDHVYLRTSAMFNNWVMKTKNEKRSYEGLEYNVSKDPFGTFYVISGCAGVKDYKAKDASETNKKFPRAEKTVDTSLPVFSAFKIRGDRLYFDAYTVDENGGTERIDSFAIEKSPSGAKNSCEPSYSDKTDVENTIDPCIDDTNEKLEMIAARTSDIEIMEVLDDGYTAEETTKKKDETTTKKNDDPSGNNDNDPSGSGGGGDTSTTKNNGGNDNTGTTKNNGGSNGSSNTSGSKNGQGGSSMGSSGSGSSSNDPFDADGNASAENGTPAQGGSKGGSQGGSRGGSQGGDNADYYAVGGGSAGEISDPLSPNADGYVNQGGNDYADDGYGNDDVNSDGEGSNVSLFSTIKEKVPTLGGAISATTLIVMCVAFVGVGASRIGRKKNDEQTESARKSSR